MLLIHDQSLEQTNEATLVQRQTKIRWAEDKHVVKGTVHLAAQPTGPSLEELSTWVDAVGGTWASDEDIAGI